MVEGEGSIIRTKQRYTDLIDVRKKNNFEKILLSKHNREKVKY